MAKALLEVKRLSIDAHPGHRLVDDVSFEVGRGEFLGLVGQSGSGKSMTGLAIPGLLPAPCHTVSGSIVFDGMDLAGMAEAQLRRLRGRRIGMVFQNPMSTLSPTLRIGTQIVDAILAHERIDKPLAWQKSRDALGRVGIPAPDERMAAYPHQLSGGMRQRVAIAIAMINDPDLVIADEPTTALDVTIQAQILHQVQKLAAERDAAFIWISHDLSVVAGLVDRIAVMHDGSIIEQGSTDQVLDAPRHPFTRRLIASIPSMVANIDELRASDPDDITYTQGITGDAQG
ncbi:MAG TPA: ABC transporter ATP-binding protein [Rhizobiaceae bacterium]|nr:ABC transporter ATP-binding protein [Rhizobiaceae bacterium]